MTRVLALSSNVLAFIKFQSSCTVQSRILNQTKLVNVTNKPRELWIYRMWLDSALRSTNFRCYCYSIFRVVVTPRDSYSVCCCLLVPCPPSADTRTIGFLFSLIFEFNKYPYFWSLTDGTALDVSEDRSTGSKGALNSLLIFATLSSSAVTALES